METTQARSLDISAILQRVRDGGYFHSIDRLHYDNYDIAQAIQIVEAIGQQRDPKFTIDEENRFAYENFIKWCHGDPTAEAQDPTTGKPTQGNLKRGIYIAGNTGTGKTWCTEIMQAYAQTYRFKVKFSEEDTPLPLFWYTFRADEICAYFAQNGDIEKFKKYPILCIQDLGQEPKETLYMGNRMNVIQQLIECRGDLADRLTLITSNAKMASDSIRVGYGNRAQSRLIGMCNYFEIKGKDRRRM